MSDVPPTPDATTEAAQKGILARYWWVVGLAIAERLSHRTPDVVVLESAARTGQATSSRSSQVLHSGLYYPPGSLKARLCVAGNRALPCWCETHGVPLKRVGKLIVATTDPEQTELEQLLRSPLEGL